MNYAIDYADVGPTRVARWQEGEPPVGFVLEDEPKKLQFLEAVAFGDTLWMELGGAGDVFALVTMRRGAIVRRTPPFIVKDERETRGWPKEQDHLLLADLARENPDFFYPMREVDEAIVRLRVWVRARTMVQRTVRIPTELRLTRVYRDLWWVSQPAEALESYLKGRIAGNPIFQGAAAYEKELEAEIRAVLKDIPVYEAVFGPIRGCGPVIGGTVIARVTDIRRFRSPAALTAYAGYHLANGQVPRRRRGVRANWDQALKQAVWLFTDVTNRQPEDTLWKAKLVARKAYEQAQHPQPVDVNGKTLFTKGHIHNRALRWLGQQFLEHVWKEWRRFEGLPTSV